MTQSVQIFEKVPELKLNLKTPLSVSLGVCERECMQNYFDRFSCLVAASRSRSCRLVRPSCWCRSDHTHRWPLHTSLILRRTSRISRGNLRELLMCLVCALTRFFI